MLTALPNIHIQTLACNFPELQHLKLYVLRLDKLHPVVSGNKFFKLCYYFDDIINNTVITYGGAYSNHLVATAYACKERGIRCIGVVRGERPAHLSHTLQHCINFGMHLHFVGREAYNQRSSSDFINELKNIFGDATVIPEGGYDKKGAYGASEIMNYIGEDITHICCATGTATTLAGLLLKCKPYQQIIAVPVIKGVKDMEERLLYLTGRHFNTEQLHVEYNYHFGGYAKKDSGLMAFMNDLYIQHQLPTDFVYTAKMMFCVFELVKKQFFKPGSKICCIHTGGLQGNLSLPAGTLTF